MEKGLNDILQNNHLFTIEKLTHNSAIVNISDTTTIKEFFAFFEAKEQEVKRRIAIDFYGNQAKLNLTTKFS